MQYTDDRRCRATRRLLTFLLGLTITLGSCSKGDVSENALENTKNDIVSPISNDSHQFSTKGLGRKVVTTVGAGLILYAIFGMSRQRQRKS